jgi:hypothetical protein
VFKRSAAKLEGFIKEKVDDVEVTFNSEKVRVWSLKDDCRGR